MSTIDVFERTDRWDSVGLNCHTCVHASNVSWPDINHTFFCTLHNISLSVELNERGYGNGEWFCKDFEDKGLTNKNALKTFNEIKLALSRNILYGFNCKGKRFREIPFDKLEKIESNK